MKRDKTPAAPCEEGSADCSEHSYWDSSATICVALFLMWLMKDTKYSKADSVNNLAFQSYKTLFKITFAFTAIVFCVKASHNLEDPECSESNMDFCTMITRFDVMSLFIMVSTFIYLELLYAINLCLEVYAIYAYFSPITRLSSAD